MKKIILVLGLTISILNSFAQTKSSYSFSVKQAVDFAMQNQHDIKNSMIDEELAHKTVAEIRASGLPQINASFDVKDFVEFPTTVIPGAGGLFGGQPGSDAVLKFGAPYQAAAGADASQLLFNAEFFSGLKGSKLYIELSTRAIARTKVEVAATVSKAYYMVLVSNERVKLLDANIARLKKTMDDTKALMDNGFVEKIDFDRLTVAYNNLLVEKEKVDRLLSTGMYLLKYQMGMEINADLTLTDKLEDMKVDLPAAGSDKFDYSKRIEYGIMETSFKLSKVDLKRKKYAYLPYAFAYGSLSENAYRSKFDLFDRTTPWYPTAIIGVTVKVPIFNGFLKNVKVQQAKLNVQKAENNMEFIKKSIDLELATSTTNLTNSAASLENQKKNIAIAEDVASVAKKKYDAGVGSNLEVLNAETALKEAQTNYISALYDAIIAKIDFDKANGNLK